MTDESLKYIITIADEQSLSKAAKKLYISSSALSRVLQKKEEELGESLFYRTPSGLVPTEPGRYFVDNARKILQLYDNLNTEFCELSDRPGGVLSISTPVRICNIILPESLMELKRRHPNITVKIHDVCGIDVEGDLLEGRADLAFIYIPPKIQSLVYEPLFQLCTIVAVPRDHPINDRRVYSEEVGNFCLRLEDLKDMDFILSAKGTNSRRKADELCEKAGFTPNVCAETVSLDVVIGLVSSGMGISIFPNIDGLIYRRFDEKVNVYNILPEEDVRSTVGVAWYSNDNLTSVARSYVSILKKLDWTKICPVYFTMEL